MDTGLGEFKQFESRRAFDEAVRKSPRSATFTKGEELHLRNARFKVAAIGKRVLTLKLLPAVYNETRNCAALEIEQLRDFYEVVNLEAAVALQHALPEAKFVDYRTTLAVLAAEVCALKQRLGEETSG